MQFYWSEFLIVTCVIIFIMSLMICEILLNKKSMKTNKPLKIFVHLIELEIKINSLIFNLNIKQNNIIFK